MTSSACSGIMGAGQKGGGGVKWSKLAAPIVVTALLCLWFGTWIVYFGTMPGLSVWGKLMGAALSLALIGVSLYVLAERIKEIRSGDEDDLDHY